MTDTEANQAAVKPGPDEADLPVPPEPWTPQRVVEWNAYYDVYVAAFVLALAFLGSANRIQSVNSGLWSLLQTGRVISEAGSPIGIGGGTTAAIGQRWINVPWLFEVTQYQIFKGVAALAPPPTGGGAAANTPLIRGEQAAASALVALNALIRALTVWLLLGLRRKGPGLWWTALCVTLAMGVTLSPAPVEGIGQVNANGAAVRVILPAIGIQLGGLVGPAGLTPETWGLFLLAVQLVLLHGALNLGKTGRIYGLIPLFLVWANVDETFAIGLLILTAATIGRYFDARRRTEAFPDPKPTPRTMLIVLLASCAATFINPSHVFGVLGSFTILLRSVGIQAGPPSLEPSSIFGKSLRDDFGVPFARAFQLYYVALVGVGLASFVLNRRRFALARFLVFVVASVTWGLTLIYTGPFALVMALVLSLNGQEWYHDAIGTEGRLGGGWVAWSTGGRFVTIALIFVTIFYATTGWGGQVGGSRFGFGFDPDDFPFESAEAIATAPVEGNVLNTTLAQGDVLAWRAGGKRRAYIDSKPHLYSRETAKEFDDLRKAIRDDDVATWRPILDAAKITSVMIETYSAPKTYGKLMTSPNWVPFYDDGSVVIFGRAAAPGFAGDVTFFNSNKLDATEMAFRRPKPVPEWVGTPRPVVEMVDSVFQNRLLARPQPHVEAARHWLRPVTVPVGTNYLPDPAHCLLAIRELRTALSSKPDDYTAYQLLAEAYRLLLAQESALIAGITPSPENFTRISQATPQSGLLALRTEQLLTAMNFAVQTLPPARSAADRKGRAELNFTLALLNRQVGAFDLARERILAIDGRANELTDNFFQEQTRFLGDLNKQIDLVQKRLDELGAQQRLSPQEKANIARSGGAPGLAIEELETAEGIGGGQSGVRPLLVDLYASTGQPEKALDLLSRLDMDDPTLSSAVGSAGVGTATHRQGLIYFLVGNYRNAVSLWNEKAISQLRTQRLMQAPTGTQVLLRGDPMNSVRMFLELPEKVDQQAGWEFELAMAALEGGLPSDFVADHFTQALELEPNLTIRPVITYYLEQLGKPVPPPRSSRSTTSSAVPPATSPPTPASEPTPASPTPAPLPPNPFGLPTAEVTPKP